MRPSPSETRASRSPYEPSVSATSVRRAGAVMMLMTPPTALVPYSVDAPLSTTSMRLTLPSGKEPRSIEPVVPTATGTPSSSTRVCSGVAPSTP